jgi:hypothetical protein
MPARYYRSHAKTRNVLELRPRTEVCREPPVTYENYCSSPVGLGFRRSQNCNVLPYTGVMDAAGAWLTRDCDPGIPLYRLGSIARVLSLSAMSLLRREVDVSF